MNTLFLIGFLVPMLLSWIFLILAFVAIIMDKWGLATNMALLSFIFAGLGFVCFFSTVLFFPVITKLNESQNLPEQVEKL